MSENTEVKYRNIPSPTDTDKLAFQFATQPKFLHDPGRLGDAGSKLIHWQQDFFLWREGYYVPISKVYIRKMVAHFLMCFNMEIHLQRLDLNLITINSNKISAILECVAAHCNVDETTLLNSWIKSDRTGHYIAVKNGVLNLNNPEKIELLDPTPLYLTFSCLPYDYDPAATCEEWLKFLSEIMQGNAEYIRLLQQWCGYLLRPDLDEHKFLLCTGEGANGKGVFFKITTAVMGRKNVSNVPLCRFHEKFSLAATYGKLVNMMSESSQSIEEDAETLLKAFTVGDDMQFEKKNRDPFEATPTSKIMISTNDRPRFADKSMAIWRRILLVIFGVQIPEELWDKKLTENLKKTLPGILNWFIAGLVDLNKNGFIKPAGTKELIEEYRQDADPCRAFLFENYRELNDEDCPIDEGIQASILYSDYKKYCIEGGFKPLNCRNFGKEIKRIFPMVDGYKKRLHGNKIAGITEVVRFYKGIAKCE